MSTNPAERIRRREKEVAASRKAIAALQREKLFSEKVLDSLPGIFYLYNQDGEIIRWNKNHETLTGFSAEELPRRNMFGWFYGEDTEKSSVIPTCSSLMARWYRLIRGSTPV